MRWGRGSRVRRLMEHLDAAGALLQSVDVQEALYWDREKLHAARDRVNAVSLMLHKLQMLQGEEEG